MGVGLRNRSGRCISYVLYSFNDGFGIQERLCRPYNCAPGPVLVPEHA